MSSLLVLALASCHFEIWYFLGYFSKSRKNRFRLALSSHHYFLSFDFFPTIFAVSFVGAVLTFQPHRGIYSEGWLPRTCVRAFQPWPYFWLFRSLWCRFFKISKLLWCRSFGFSKIWLLLLKTFWQHCNLVHFLFWQQRLDFSESQIFQIFLSDIKKVYEPFKLSNYPFMSSLPDYLGLRKIPDMDNAKEEVRFPREVMNKLIMNYLVTG